MSTDPTPAPPAGPVPGEEAARAEAVRILDSYFRLTLRIDLDEDIPAAAEEIAEMGAAAEQRGRDETEEERADLERQNCELNRAHSAEQAAHHRQLAAAEQRGAEKEREGGAGLIAAERERQITEEHRTPDHDGNHWRGELARAAAMYALPIEYRYDDVLGAMWPQGWRFRPTPENRLRELIKAGALIAAEIDRLLRVLR